jgi:hypothetical protein
MASSKPSTYVSREQNARLAALSLEAPMSRLRSYLTIFVVASTVVLLPRVLGAQADTKADLTGKWSFSVTTDAGTGTPTVTFKQTGDTLTGHYSSQLLGEADLRGKVADGKFSFAVRVDVQGTGLVVTYSGTIESTNALKGTVDLGGQGSGTFTAKRQ